MQAYADRFPSIAVVCLETEEVICDGQLILSDMSASSTRSGLDHSADQACLDNTAQAGISAGLCTLFINISLHKSASSKTTSVM